MLHNTPSSVKNRNSNLQNVVFTQLSHAFTPNLQSELSAVVDDRKLRNIIELHNSLLPESLDCRDSFCEAEGYLRKVPVLLHDKLDHRRRGGLSDLSSHDDTEWCLGFFTG